MKTTFIIALAGSLLLAPAAMAADSGQEFVDKAAVGGMFEVESGKLARTRSESPDLRALAMMIEQDHRKANVRLAEVAKGETLTVPTTLDSPHAAKLKDLEATRTGFDAKFLSVQKSAHAESIATFEAYAKDGDNKQLKALAGDMLPTLKQHHDQIAKLMGNEEKTPKPVKPVD